MFHTLQSFDTVSPADSVEWCPIKHFRGHFVCGTYQLIENEPNKRVGQIYFFRLVEDATLNLIQTLDMEAVLDMKWLHAKWKNMILLGIATSAGYIEIFELQGDLEKCFLSTKWKVSIGGDRLALSLDWSTGKRLMDDDAGDDVKFAVSDSKGSVSVFRLGDTGVEEVAICDAHSNIEAWIVGFDYWNENVIYTGGDDCKFKSFDLRSGEKPVMTNKCHTAGVVSIQSNAKREHLLFTGSYDEILRSWDTRNFKNPLGNENLNGGIWRLKWEPFEKQYLLAACMYNGCKIIDCRNPELPVVSATYDEHRNILYGCDWSMLTKDEVKNITGKEDSMLVATCSFYDHLLNLSTVKLK